MERDTITALTIAVSVYRKLRAMGVYDMPMKLTNLTGKAMKARALIDDIGKAYDKFTEDGGEHLADLQSIASDLTNMGDDLAGAVRVMGNGSGVGSEPQPSPVVSPKPAPAVIEPEQPKIESTATPAPLEVGQAAAVNFQPGGYTRVDAL